MLRPTRIYAPILPTTSPTTATLRAFAAGLMRSIPREKEILRVAPADIAASRIGHFGFFREQFRGPLWRPSVDWLAAS